MKKTLLVAAAVVALLVIVIAGATLFLDANQFRPALQSQISSALGRRVVLGDMTLSLFSGAVSVRNVSIDDDPSFSSAPFITAKAVTAGVELLPLILSRTLRVQSFTLEEPHVVLLRSPAGVWNWSNLGGTSKPSQGDSASRLDVLVRKLSLVRGEVVVASMGSASKNRVYQDVNIEASNLSYTSEFPFRMSAKTPGDGTLDLDGKAGPLNAKDVAATPLRANVQVKHFDLAASGLIDPASGLAGLIAFAGDLTSDGRHAHSKGKLRADKIQLVKGSSPARVPIEVDYVLEHDLKNQSGALMQGDVHVGKALARLTGTYSTRGETATAKMKLTGKNMPVPEVEASLPAIGVTLPAGASLQGGTLDVDVSIEGPIDRLVAAGPINVANTKLRSFDLGGKMAAVATFAGLSRATDTIIQTLGAAVRIAPDGIQANDLQLVVPTIGSLTGSGTIAASGGLNFRMVAKLQSGGILESVSRLASLGHPSNGVPFRVEGTMANPVFVPDVAGAVGNMIKQPNAATGVSGLLDKLLRK